MQIATAQWHFVGNTRCCVMDDIAASQYVIHLMKSDTATDVCIPDVGQKRRNCL